MNEEVVTYQSFDPPDDSWAKKVCKIGQGAECCRYLTMGPNGWSCAKHTSLARLLDARAAAGEMRARGDNCLGRGDILLNSNEGAER